MKKLILSQIVLFCSFCFYESVAMAQQAKAYETVKYTARIKNGVLHLDYANGYVGASKIRLVSTKQKEQLFAPQSGTPEANGDFVLKLSSDADKRDITLRRITEETEAPNIIRANYRKKGRVLALLFYKNKP